jgi:hypothetical protein
LAEPCFAKRVIIPVTGKVNSFGTYSFVGKLDFNIEKVGEREFGKIIVEGTYNGEYPWIMRIYTDNTSYTGIATAARPASPAGLVSTDGRFVVPIMVNAPNMGKSGYKTVSDINQPDYKTYISDKVTQDPFIYTDCIIMAIDPRNELWVAGENGTLFDKDDNTLGDTTMPTPFELKFKANFDERSVKANYTANLYIELVSCP